MIDVRVAQHHGVDGGGIERETAAGCAPARRGRPGSCRSPAAAGGPPPAGCGRNRSLRPRLRKIPIACGAYLNIAASRTFRSAPWTPSHPRVSTAAPSSRPASPPASSAVGWFSASATRTGAKKRRVPARRAHAGPECLRARRAGRHHHRGHRQVGDGPGHLHRPRDGAGRRARRGSGARESGVRRRGSGVQRAVHAHPVHRRQHEHQHHVHAAARSRRPRARHVVSRGGAELERGRGHAAHRKRQGAAAARSR